MKNLLYSLATINLQNAIIVMDTGKYQNSLPENNPKVSRRKQQLVNYCLYKGLELEKNDKTVIWGQINSILGTM